MSSELDVIELAPRGAALVPRLRAVAGSPRVRRLTAVSKARHSRCAQTWMERLLDSPFRHVLGGRLCQIRYVGRRTGRTHSFTATAVVTSRGILVVAGGGTRKTWWRNFEIPRPAMVLVHGRWVCTTGVVLLDSVERADAVEEYRAGTRSSKVGADDPIVRFRPNNDET